MPSAPGMLVDVVGPVTLGGNGLISFEEARIHGHWRERYLCIGQRRAYELGNGCGTCEFYFERLEGANQAVSPETLRERLREGLTSARDLAGEQFARILPNEVYTLLLVDLHPRLVEPRTPDDYFVNEQVDLWGIDDFWGVAHYTKVPYYRADDRDMAPGSRLSQFVVPMVPPKWLHPETVSAYETLLGGDARATAVAVGVLDVKQPATWPQDPAPSITEHWCLVHYLLDGHHKLFAAARTGKTIRLLSFVAHDHSLASADDIARLAQRLRQAI
jgi:hypothetical protein